MNYLKNINYETVQNFAGLVTAGEGQVVSRTIAQNDTLSLTLFAFAAGEEISTHKSEGDALVIALEGKCEITIDGKKHYLSKGDSIVMPAGHPHAVFAPEAFKMFLVVVFGQN